MRSFLGDEHNEQYMLELTELVRLLSLLQEVLAVNQRLLNSSQVGYSHRLSLSTGKVLNFISFLRLTLLLTNHPRVPFSRCGI